MAVVCRAIEGLPGLAVDRRHGIFPTFTQASVYAQKLNEPENGHTVPSLETLEKFARALEIPLYEIFYEGKEQPQKFSITRPNGREWEATDKEHEELRRFVRLFSRLDDHQRDILLKVALKMARR